jgi:hypothetical protein
MANLVRVRRGRSGYVTDATSVEIGLSEVNSC